MSDNTIYAGHIADNVREQIAEYIKLSLGHPVVRLELTDQQIDLCINTAVSNFSQWVPGTEHLKVFDLTPGQNKYDLPTILGTNDYIDIRQVIYNRANAYNTVGEFISNFVDGGLFPEWGFAGYMGSVGSYGGNMTDFVIQGMYNEMFLRTLGLEGSWQVIQNDLYLSPMPLKESKAGVIYTTFATDMNIRRIEWVREWAFAHAKEILGRTRGKFPGGMPGPRGGNIAMDGQVLLAEAKEAKMMLQKRLDEYIEPMGFFTG